MPLLYDTKFLIQIFNRKQRTNNLDKAVDVAKKKFKENAKKWEEDKYFAMQQKLWIQFLTAPQKVVEYIKEVEKRAAEIQSSSYRALHIALPK